MDLLFQIPHGGRKPPYQHISYEVTRRQYDTPHICIYAEVAFRNRTCDILVKIQSLYH